MRAVFSVLGLLIMVAVIGVLAKKQLGSVAGPALPAVTGIPATAGAPPATPQQTVKQFQQAVESQMQQPRPMPDDPK